MSFSRPTLSVLIERGRADINARLTGAEARLRHNVLDVLTRMHQGAMNDFYAYAGWIADQILPDTADGAFLARHAARWGLSRKAATFAAGTAIASGVNGRTIPADARLSRIDGTQYRVATATTIEGGTATLPLKAVESGSGQSADAGQELTFQELIAGVNAVATVSAGGIADGSAEEMDDSLLDRLLARIQNPPQGGSAADYKLWALAQPGVTRAWVLPGWLGSGTVGLTFVMDGRPDIIPTAADIAEVQAALDYLRPVTAALTVFAPIPQPVDIAATIFPDTPAVRAAVLANLGDMFLRDAEPGGTIRRSRLSEAVSIAAGEAYHELIAPAQDIVAATAAKLPVPGAVTFS